MGNTCLPGMGLYLAPATCSSFRPHVPHSLAARMTPSIQSGMPTQTRYCANFASLQERAALSPCSHAIWLNSWIAGALWPTASFFGSELGTSIVAGRAISASDGKFNLNTAAIDSLLIPLPPTLSEQREIVAVLDAMDRKIDLYRRKRAVLDEQHDEWAVGRRYITPVVLTFNEALPEADLAEATAA